jgi:tetratricopeptide (TPR) repeat protein
MEIEGVEIIKKLEEDGKNYCFYTKGMKAFGKPELELRWIPVGFLTRAENIILSIADFVMQKTFDVEEDIIELRDMNHKHTFPLRLVNLPLGSSLIEGSCMRIVDYYEVEDKPPEGINNVIVQSFFLDAMDDLNRENYKEAYVEFSKCLEINPDFVYAYKFRGEVLLNLNEFAAARNDFDMAIEKGDDDPAVYFGRAIAYAMQNDYEKSIEDISRYIDLNPDEPIGYEQRAAIYEKFGNREAAISDRKKAISLKEKK